MIETERLALRGWREGDLEPLLAICTDAEVMRFMIRPLVREEVEGLMARQDDALRSGRPGLFALERAGELIGWTGLAVPRPDVPCYPAVEIGWRLARSAWGQGYATEAARAVLRHAFDTLDLSEVVSYTAVVNRRSVAVMERLGMRRDEHGDFAHPALSPGHELEPHVLYRLDVRAWRAG